MKINSVFSSQNMQKCPRPCFQANIMPKLHETLITEAKNQKALPKLIEKVNDLSKWGSQKSFVNFIITPDRQRQLLVLNNYHLSNKKYGSLGVHAKDSILKQFLSLTEDDILRAEKNIIA